MNPLHQRIIDINREQSERYVSDETARRRYWAKHPTFFSCIKCMDGRVNFPVMTNTPIGIVKPFRAIGGKFNIWWPSFLGRFRSWVSTAMRVGSRSAVFVTYHYSMSDAHLGCAGWKYDTAAARTHAGQLRDDLTAVFGEQIVAIVAGVETDRDILTLHGPKGDISGDALIGKTEEEILVALKVVFPTMPDDVAQDMVPFLHGNAVRVQTLTEQPRNTVEKDHDERIIAVGQGFDWLVHENLALIINDADPNLANSIRVAASLIEKNLAKNGSSNDGATLLTSIPYESPGMDYRQAVARSKGLAAFAMEVIQEQFPGLIQSGHLRSMSAVMWEPDKRLEIIQTT